MSTHALPIGPARRRRHPPRLTAARARLHSHSLDRELGAGIATWRTPLHAARALQLTGRRRRRLVADSLERMLADAHRPAAQYRLTAAVPPCRPSVLGCESQIADLIGVLCADAPVAAEGMARLLALLGDGIGPLYTPNRIGDLQRALHHISRWITVPD